MTLPGYVRTNGRIASISDIVQLHADGDSISDPKPGFVSARAAKRAYRNAARLDMRDRLPDVLIGMVIGGFLVAAIILVIMPFIENVTLGGV